MSETALPPYAAMLQISVHEPASDGRGPVLVMAHHIGHEGRPGMLHGGAIAGLLDMAATAAVQQSLAAEGQGRKFKPIGITIDYVRGGRTVATYARGRVTRVGRRVATVVVEAWQDEGTPQIAAARLHMLLSGLES